MEQEGTTFADDDSADAPGARQLPISDDDLRAVVRLIGDVAGMSAPVAERRRALIVGLAKMVDADVWAWAHSTGLREGKPMPLGAIDGGFVDEAERTRLWHASCDAEWNAAVAPTLPLDRPSTIVFDEAHPGWGDGSLYRKVIAPTGLTRLAFSIHPLPNGVVSAIGLHRRAGRPPYTARELAIVHLVLGQVDWLHDFDPPPAAESLSLRDLTPREREVLFYLLAGEGRKQIAARLKLSEYTISDHLKSLYRRLGVGSRGELMSKFLPIQSEGWPFAWGRKPGG